MRKLRRWLLKLLLVGMDIVALALSLWRHVERLYLAETPEDRSLHYSAARADWLNLMWHARRITGPTDRALKRGGIRRVLEDPRQLRFRFS